MRILLVGTGPTFVGGWGTYTTLLHEWLKSMGHTVELCEISASPVSHMTSPFTVWGTAGRITAHAQKFRPEITHCTVEPFALALALVPKRFTGKRVITVHGSYGIRIFDTWWTRILAVRTFKTVAAFIAVSEFTSKRVAEHIKAKNGKHLADTWRSRVRVIRNAAVIPAWNGPHKSGAVRSILCVGEVKPRKGILESLEGCAAYAKISTQPFLFSIVGPVQENSEYVRTIRERITALKLESSVEITGPVSSDELRERYAKADMLLMPAKTTHDTFEGYGIVYIEANSYGIPCIGPEKSGAAEAIKEGKTGYRVNPENPQAMASAMKKILDTSMIKPADCRSWAENHEPKKVFPAMEAVYVSILKNT